MVRPFAFLLACLLAAVGSDAGSATAIGTVARLQGACQGAMNGTAEDLSPGATVFADEAISTGPAARLEITLGDRTVVTLGEKATLTLDEFVFRPAGASRLHLVVAGAFRFVSGRLSAGATRQASVTTPFATIGIRGTDFWGGPIDGRFGVVVLEGRVAVSHRGRTALLYRPHSGVDLDTLASMPGPVTTWATAKIDRAVATVSFR